MGVDGMRPSPVSWWDDDGGVETHAGQNDQVWREPMPIEQSEFWPTEAEASRPPVVSPGAGNVLARLDPMPVATVEAEKMGEPEKNGEPEAPAVAGAVSELIGQGREEPASWGRSGRRNVSNGVASPFSMGKYLTICGSLDADQGAMRRLELPRKSFRARLKLWTESLFSSESQEHLRFPPRDISSHGPRRADGNLSFS